MTAKQYLQSYQRLERNYNLVVEQIKSIESEMITLRSPGFDERVQTSPKKDPIGEMVCNLEKEKGKLGIKMTQYRARMLLIKRQIAEIDSINNEYYVILLLRYVLYKDWKFICDTLNLSRSQANVFHGRALLEFDTKFGQNYADK